MARRKATQPARGLSVLATLAANAYIEKAVEAFCDTAPRAVAAIGGRAGIQARFRGMAVGQGEHSIGILGPVPELTLEEWEAMSDEHFDSLRVVWDTWRGVSAGERPGAGATPTPTSRARSFEVHR